MSVKLLRLKFKGANLLVKSKQLPHKDSAGAAGCARAVTEL
jgi:hypothetical protein